MWSDLDLALFLINVCDGRSLTATTPPWPPPYLNELSSSSHLPILWFETNLLYMSGQPASFILFCILESAGVEIK